MSLLETIIALVGSNTAVAFVTGWVTIKGQAKDAEASIRQDLSELLSRERARLDAVEAELWDVRTQHVECLAKSSKLEATVDKLRSEFDSFRRRGK